MKLVNGKNGIELVHPSGNWELKKDFGFSPVESLVAAVGSCGMYVFEAILNGSKIDHEFVETKVAFEAAEKRPHPVKEITIDYYIKMDEANHAKAERIMELVPKSCPVMQSLSADVTVIEKLHFV